MNMTEKHVDSQTVFLIRLLRVRAHLASVAEAPRVSKEAAILNTCAAELEALDGGSMPQSEFDRLMK